MMYYAYSDASTRDDSCAATSLILTDDKYVTCFTNVYEHVSSSMEAELLGVVQTMQYISQHCPASSKVVLLTDSKAIAVQYIRILSTWKVREGCDFYEYYTKLLQYSAGFNVNVQHIRGHQHTHNPNKVCDILSKLYSSDTK